jgi:hypothetical protein
MDITSIDIKSIATASLLFAALIAGSKRYWVFGWTYKALEQRCEAAETKNDKHDQLLEDKFLPALLDSTHLLQEIHESYEKEAIRAAIDRENRDRS